MGMDYIFMFDIAQPHGAHITHEFLEGADICSMDYPSRSLDHNFIEYIWDSLRKGISQHSSLLRTSQKLKVQLLEKWALLPQILIDTLKNSMATRFEAYITLHIGHTPY
ncbi:hypothetical protein TNCV_3171891 [Trichonephila clavipes]|nr:hypothetical protein TNCV_3171891 [Trichonephila clavipes]